MRATAYTVEFLVYWFLFCFSSVFSVCFFFYDFFFFFFFFVLDSIIMSVLDIMLMEYSAVYK